MKKPPCRGGFPFYHGAEQPIDESIHRTGAETVYNHRSGDGKHFGTHAQDEPLRLKLHGGGCHGVGKSGDGHQRSCPGVFCQVIIKAQPGEQGRNAHQSDGDPAGGILLLQAHSGIPVHQHLPQGADKPAGQKGEDAVLPKRGLGASFLHQLCILLVIHAHPSMQEV